MDEHKHENKSQFTGILMQKRNGNYTFRALDKSCVSVLSLAICLGLTVVVGIILLSTCVTIEGHEFNIDYTDCKPGLQLRERRCKDVTDEVCSCYIPISITKPMKAPVSVFYELESYDQIIKNHSQSRDDNQLAGHHSTMPSHSCGQYSYVNTTDGRKPIAPCGGLADAMFNDTFSLQSNNTYVPNIRTGLISEEDKKQFRNPVGNLSEAFKNFSKPINWNKHVWELDPVNPENNGFQNEAFIIWMKTDLKRKPFFRVNHTDMYKQGLPVGDYTLRVTYAYPTSRYAGRRHCIVSSKHKIVDYIKMKIGVALLVIGLILIAGIMVMRRKIRSSDRIDKTRSGSNSSLLFLLLSHCAVKPKKVITIEIGTNEREQKDENRLMNPSIMAPLYAVDVDPARHSCGVISLTG